MESSMDNLRTIAMLLQNFFDEKRGYSEKREIQKEEMERRIEDALIDKLTVGQIVSMMEESKGKNSKFSEKEIIQFILENIPAIQDKYSQYTMWNDFNNLTKTEIRGKKEEDER